MGTDYDKKAIYYYLKTRDSKKRNTMKKYFIVLLLAGVVLTLNVCNKNDLPASDPVMTLGHGTIFGSNGKQVKITKAFINTVQKFYLNKLFAGIKNKETENYISPSQIQEIQDVINQHVKDPVLANALLVDWLLEKARPKEKLSYISMVNNALRWKYLWELNPEAVQPKDGSWAKGIDFETAKGLERRLDMAIVLPINLVSKTYCEECLDAGVPVPDSMFGSKWRYVGDITDEFIDPNSKGELWIYESESPKGVCLALPRFGPGKDSAGILGIICLGTESSKACFFDNPNGVSFKRNEKTDFRNFLGGADLVANGQGVCTDCHAGENPFVVHPDQPVFKAVADKLKPLGWYIPLVIATWPKNPGPTNILDGISSPGKCTMCHIKDNAGRFPQVSSELPGYCDFILPNATSIKKTMPPNPEGKINVALFNAHINALRAACNTLPSDPGDLVGFAVPDNPGFLSSPLIISPVYQCATKVAVESAVLNAKVILSVNGIDVATYSPARNPLLIEFSGLAPLKVGDLLSVRQELSGISSATSPKIQVRDYKADYPKGLPAPVISPSLIYACAEVIGVVHVPSSIVTVYKNGRYVGQQTGSVGRTLMYAGTIKKGDTFTAIASLCNATSEMSAVGRAIAAPTHIPGARFDPAIIFTGQELISLYNLTNGSQTQIGEASFGNLGGFSVPESWYPNFDLRSALGRPLGKNDRLYVTQKLCDLISTRESSTTITCDELPAPRIEQPFTGNAYVVVKQSIPGARVRIYDFSNTEIGDGSGKLIQLSRPLRSSDGFIVAVQQVDTCSSKTGHRVNIQ